MTAEPLRVAERLALARARENLLGVGPAESVQVGRYRLEERIGAGANGVVFRAIDPRLDRAVAIKLLTRRRTSSRAMVDARRRLRREAQALAGLSHPGIVTVYDVGTYSEPGADDGLFVAMELIDGPSLRQWLGDRPRPWSQVVESFVQAGRGLSAAHREGVVHRDFKPDNVMLTSNGTVKVLDFGLARTWSDLESHATPVSVSEPIGLDDETFTATGVVMGTPVYMAPEQHLGEVLTPAADQFAFCVSLYEALHGERPYGGRSLSELARAKVEGPPAAPSDDVPGWLDALVRRGLQPDPDRRWPSMEALVDALARGRPSALRRARPALVIGVVVTMGLGVALARTEDECGTHRVGAVWNDEQRAALHQRLTEDGSPYGETASRRVTELMDGFASDWARRRGDVCETDDSPSSARGMCLDRRLASMRATLRVLTGDDAPDPAQAVEVAVTAVDLSDCNDEPEGNQWHQAEGLAGFVAQLDEAAVLQNSGRYDRGIEIARALLDRPEALEPGPRAAAQLRLAALYAHVGELKVAAELLSEAYFTAESAGLQPLVFDTSLNLATLHGDQLEQPEEAQPWLRHAEAAWERLGRDPKREAHLWRARATVASAEGRIEDALAAERRCLELRRDLLPDDDIDVAIAHSNLAAALAAAARYGEAAEHNEKALVVWRSQLGETHPNVAISEDNLGIMLGQTGRYEEAATHHRDALEIALASVGPQHSTTANIRTNLGIVLGSLARYDEALTELRAAVEIYRAVLGDEHPDLGRGLLNLGLVRGQSGDHAGSLHDYRRAQDVFIASLGAEHPLTWAIRVNTADELRALGRHAEGLETLEPAIEPLTAGFGDTHPYVAAAHTSLGRLRLERGELARAHEELRRAMAIWEAQPTDPAFEAETRFALARALEGMGQAEPARTQAQRARELYGQHEGLHREQVAELDAWLAGAEG